MPNMTTLFKIAEYFSIEPEYFLADNYTSYVEWLAEKKHMSVAQVINPEWMEEEVQPVEPDPYEGKTITRPPLSFRFRCTSALLCG